jgi:hypothetical protein
MTTIGRWETEDIKKMRKIGYRSSLVISTRFQDARLKENCIESGAKHLFGKYSSCKKLSGVNLVFNWNDVDYAGQGGFRDLKRPN